MKPFDRRKLLTTTAATMAAATLSLPDAQGAAVQGTGAFTVRAGEGRPGGVWLVHGEKAFSTKVSGIDVAKKYAAIEVHTPPNHGPELHVHPGQNEFFFLLKGSIGVQCGSDRTILRAGDALMAPADVSHAFVTLGTAPAHMLLVYDPAGDMEAFFAEYAPLVDVEGEPDREKLLATYTHHGLRVVGPPLTRASFLPEGA